jgi:hypothetical protein
LAIYGTDEATTWGWNEYHPELSGERHRVVVPYSGNLGTPVDNNGQLMLLVEGEALLPTDESRDMRQEVRIGKPQRAGVGHVVRHGTRWLSMLTTFLAERRFEVKECQFTWTS